MMETTSHMCAHGVMDYGSNVLQSGKWARVARVWWPIATKPNLGPHGPIARDDA
jgi:hypothetical protein